MDGTKTKKVGRRSFILTATTVITGAAAATSASAEVLSDTDAERAARRTQSKVIRDDATNNSVRRSYPSHETNKDEEELSPKFIGNFCKGLTQKNEYGEVDETAYKQLKAILASGITAEFENIPVATVPAHTNPVLERLRANNRIEYSTLGSGIRINSTERFYSSPQARDELMTRQHSKRMRHGRFHAEAAASGTGQAKVVDPQAGLAYDLEGFDSHRFAIEPPPSYRSVEAVAEIAENYWMALLRDVPYVVSQTPSDSRYHLVQSAVAHLNSFGNAFKGPKDNITGKVTAQTLFRGSTPGDQVGPYLSQFLLRDVPFGAYQLNQIIRNGYKTVKTKNGGRTEVEQVFMISHDDWYQSQLGIVAPQVPYGALGGERHNYRPRELCNYVHVDELFQAYLNAAVTLAVAPNITDQSPNTKDDLSGGLGVPKSAGNPYTASETQAGFGTLGEPNFASLVAEVATRALKAVWFQKWYVHRRLRPEAYAGHIHFMKKMKRTYPLAPHALDLLDPVLTAVNNFNKTQIPLGSPLPDNAYDSYFLPMAFADGCPNHPAYGAGHATVAGACVTLLKAFYQTNIQFSKLGGVKDSVLVPTFIYVPNVNGDLVALTKNGQLLAKTNQPPTQDESVPYAYEDLASTMTVEGELNKLAANISLARNFAGVHWRSDHAASLPLGEQVAIEFLKELVTTYNEDVSFHFNKFDGTSETIEA